ncbi:hypothetical protein K2Z84_07370 [Candidatus Binatia bacterium]|jgi:hypothetical protein|nr:hypothetical protein [Candidatus Binatia bacterium]
MQRERGHRPSPASATAEPLFPPRQAFVVHFQADSDASDARCAGRVEHVLSGRGARFHNADDLLAAMRRLLSENGAADDAAPVAPPTPIAARERRPLPRERSESRTPR